MKLNYFAETDWLYIDLSEKSSTDSREIFEGVVLDYDDAENLVGIGIDNAIAKVKLKELFISGLLSHHDVEKQLTDLQVSKNQIKRRFY